MFKFMLQKLLHKKWMFISLLIGNILLIAISCSYPMYKNASLQRILTDSFDDYLKDKNSYPFTLTLKGHIDKTKKAKDYIAAKQLYDNFSDELCAPVIQKVGSYFTNNYIANSLMGRDDKTGDQRLTLSYLTELGSHINIISGKMYSDKIQSGGIIEAIVNRKTFDSLNLIIGEEYEFESLTDSNENPIKLRITGVFENSKEQDNYWVKNATSYQNTCFISDQIFADSFIDLDTRSYSIDATWYLLMDYQQLKPEQVAKVMSKTKEITEAFQMDPPKYMSILESYNQKAKKISVTLMILQIPVLLLLCSFIFMIAGQMLDMEQNEIALLKSRGSSKWQLIRIYTYQSVFVALISSLVALPLGKLICMALGSTNAFLEFVQRSALTVKIDQEVILYCIGAAIISVGVMVLPVYKHANVTIVGYKQKKNRKNKKLWQSMYLDVVLLAVSIYGLYTFSNQKGMLIAKMMKGDSLDPLLYLSSSLFIIGASLVALRIQPVLVWFVFNIGKKKWKPASYATFLQILRNGHKQNFIMVFFMFTIALGIFNATIARTILTNSDNNIKYRTGADVVEKEVWSNNSSEVANDPSIPLTYYEPSFEKYQKLSGASSITKVSIDHSMSARPGDTSVKCSVMGINTKEFGETSWFKDDLLPEDYHRYLNALATNSDAILVSSNFRDLYEVKLGDVITYKNDDASAMGIVYGFVDYWPGYVPQTTEIVINGTAEVTDNFLIVAHFLKIQDTFGLTPYQVWMKASGTTDFIYDFTEKNNVQYSEFTDVSEEMRKIRNDTIFQGTNGILTMCFTVVLLLSCIGFLIYWILSIKNRELLFGVLRAMGMSKREIITMLIEEQIFSTGLALVTGTLIGVLASQFFVPLIQIAYSTSDQILPLQLITEGRDMLRLFAIILTVIIICVIILGRLISKIKISQALKLGED